MSKAIIPSKIVFPDVDGNPLENGFIYIGEAGLDAQDNQITVYWDKGLTQVASQPIRTKGGYPVNGTVISRLYTGKFDYSMKVQDKNTATVQIDLNAGLNSQTSEDTYFNVKDFGAVGDGVTDDTAAIQSAVNSISNGTLFFPNGIYNITSTITINASINPGVSLIGENGIGAKFDYVGTTPNIPMVAYEGGSGSGFIKVENLRFENTYRTGDTVLNGISALRIGRKTDAETIGATWGTGNVTVTKVSFLYFDVAVDAYSESNQITIEDCWAFVFTGTAYKAQVAGTAIVSGAACSAMRVHNCHAQGGQAGSLGVQLKGASCSVTGCVIQSAEPFDGVKFLGCEAFFASNNYYEAGVGTNANFCYKAENSKAGHIGECLISGLTNGSYILIDSASSNVNIGPNFLAHSAGVPQWHVNAEVGSTGVRILGKQEELGGASNLLTGSFDVNMAVDQQVNFVGRVTGGTFTSSKSLVNVSASSNSTIFTCPDETGAYLVTISQGSEDYNASALVQVSDVGQNAQIFNAAQTNANLTVTVSGRDIIANNGIAGTRTVLYSITRIN